jgi:hypothetical protein
MNDNEANEKKGKINPKMSTTVKVLLLIGFIVIVLGAGFLLGRNSINSIVEKINPNASSNIDANAAYLGELIDIMSDVLIYEEQIEVQNDLVETNVGEVLGKEWQDKILTPTIAIANEVCRVEDLTPPERFIEVHGYLLKACDQEKLRLSSLQMCIDDLNGDRLNAASYYYDFRTYSLTASNYINLASAEMNK